jgi:hypothetical protein
MSAVTAAFLETGQKGYGAATPPEAGEGAVQKNIPRCPLVLIATLASAAEDRRHHRERISISGLNGNRLCQ